MADLEQQLRDAAAANAAARAERDRVIAEAAKAGLTRRRIAELTGLSHQRIQQIVERDRRPNRPSHSP